MAGYSGTPLPAKLGVRSGSVPTDLTEDVVRDVALPLGQVDVKVCAIDDTSSALKLVVRQALR